MSYTTLPYENLKDVQERGRSAARDRAEFQRGPAIALNPLIDHAIVKLATTAADNPVDRAFLTGYLEELAGRKAQLMRLAATELAKATPVHHCSQCGRAMNPVSYAVGPVCNHCCKANHRRVAGGGR